MKDKHIELKLWFFVAVIIAAGLLASEVFGQQNITKRTVTLDSLSSRSHDTIWFTNGIGGKVALRINGDTLFFQRITADFLFIDTAYFNNIEIRDTSLIDYIEAHGGGEQAAYGEMYYDDVRYSYGDPDDNAWITIDIFNEGLLNNFTFVNSDTADWLVCGKDGTYEIAYNITPTVLWSGTAPETSTAVFINDVLITKSKSIRSHLSYGSTGFDVNLSRKFFIELQTGDTIKLRYNPGLNVDGTTIRGCAVTIKEL